MCPFRSRRLFPALGLLTALAAQQPTGDLPPADLFAALRAVPLQPAQSDGEAIEIVDVDGKPVADAEVHLAPDRAAGARVRAWQALGPRPFERQRLLPFVLGAHHRSNGQGIVLVPSIGREVFAWHGERLGYARVTAGEAVRIVLRERTVCSVRVVDAEGKPTANVGLALFAIGRADLAATPFEVTTRSAEDGTATLHFCADLIRTGPGAQSGIRSDVIGPLVTAPFVLADDRKTATAELKLPPCGRVQVTAHDGDGKPRTDLTDLRLRVAGRPHTRPEHVSQPPSRVDDDGAFWDHVVLDCTLVATARSGERLLQCERKGPLRPGEIVRFELQPTK